MQQTVKGSLINPQALPSVQKDDVNKSAEPAIPSSPPQPRSFHYAITPIFVEGEEIETQLPTRDSRALSVGAAMEQNNFKKKLEQENRKMVYYNVYKDYLVSQFYLANTNSEKAELYNIFELTDLEFSSIKNSPLNYDKAAEEKTNELIDQINKNPVALDAFNDIFIPLIFDGLQKIVEKFNLKELINTISELILSSNYNSQTHNKLLKEYAKNYTNALNAAYKLNTFKAIPEENERIKDFINLYFLYYKPTHTLKLIAKENKRAKIEHSGQSSLGPQFEQLRQEYLPAENSLKRLIQKKLTIQAPLFRLLYKII